ncbi:MAG: hypothetical protein A2031_05930 [Deltaproteobacteria bacterium RBG_19FT_COMBO_43_11]|jgi:hypothetical protein|nr:MAG: hypothetical protein A2W27_07050 [Deltaproteobacteria bacterium RBG_16_44_11]OGP91121.1 MAG: hypothetical protein A2031_05930 [Deltaproteobacteria bacterium RBG_19FT_COMBO_43_11]
MANEKVPSWIEENQTLALIFAFVLLALYVAPVYIIGFVAWITSGFQEENFWFGWFAAFIKSGESTLNLFHKILLPILSGLSVVVFRGPKGRKILSLAVFLLFSLVVTIFVAVLFDMDKTQTALRGLNPPLDLSLVKAFLSRIQESLMMYLMLLIGIEIVERSK